MARFLVELWLGMSQGCHPGKGERSDTGWAEKEKSLVALS